MQVCISCSYPPFTDLTSSDRLAGNWGIVDVEDCIHATRILSNTPYNLIDPSRVVIRGGSAGGFSALATLSIASDFTVFAAGTSSYGVSDLKKLNEDTHKFESSYLPRLVGGTPNEIPEVYRARSPVFHADNIIAPLLVSRNRLTPDKLYG
jgi:dipeptidyl aminopeptidase/acylaminoacyl peptidase